MTKSANEVMREAIFAAVADALQALKNASKGVPNTLLREVNAIHANSSFADLPPELQAAITASVRDALSRLLKEGYSVSQGRPEPSAPPRDRGGAQDRRPPPRGAGRPARGPGKPGGLGGGRKPGGPGGPGGPGRPGSPGKPRTPR